MNNVLKLKGVLQTKRAHRRGAPELPPHTKVTSEDVSRKIAQLQQVREYWKKQTIAIDPLVEVHYYTVAAKSNRIQLLLKGTAASANASIVGADFETIDGKDRHVITHYVSMETVNITIRQLEECRALLKAHGDVMTSDELKAFAKAGLSAADKKIWHSGKSAFAQILRDVHYVSRFDVKTRVPGQTNQSLVTIYDTNRNESQTVELLNSLGVDINAPSLLDPTTIFMLPDQYTRLAQAAPYLVSMSLKDTLDLSFEVSQGTDAKLLTIPRPANEPTIGVIDTGFDSQAYFSDWVEYHDMIDTSTRVNKHDLTHGTEVSSIIVDGPTLNPSLDDGCGRFRVRHFAVAAAGRNSSFSILQKIERIIADNQDITVWNFSLGSILEVPENHISPEAAKLDELQNRYGVIFVVAGTNKGPRDATNMPKRLGAPADSINSMVVNASTILKEPADYTRVGPVLHFYRKPDIACFGGDDMAPMAVYSCNHVATTCGTSFAAPWIARKLAFLIHVMHLSREIAKALIIDAASGWKPLGQESTQLGYCIVPISINDIVRTPSNEIRFVIEGVATVSETYNYRIPVPIVKDRYPYMARATLCYFPECNKNQGVDYTSTELDFHFGRMKPDGAIDSLNNNVQDDPTAHTYEQDARLLYRKWDNVKQVGDEEKNRFVSRVTRGIPYWGFKIRKVERSTLPSDANDISTRQPHTGTRFGIVVTLRGMDGFNHFDEFVRNCQIQPEPWIVEQLDINTHIELNNEADVEIDFDDEDKH